MLSELVERSEIAMVPAELSARRFLGGGSRLRIVHVPTAAGVSDIDTDKPLRRRGLRP